MCDMPYSALLYNKVGCGIIDGLIVRNAEMYSEELREAYRAVCGEAWTGLVCAVRPPGHGLESIMQVSDLVGLSKVLLVWSLKVLYCMYVFTSLTKGLILFLLRFVFCWSLFVLFVSRFYFLFKCTPAWRVMMYDNVFRFHVFTANRPSETASTKAKTSEEEIYAVPPDPRQPRVSKWLHYCNELILCWRIAFVIRILISVT